MINMKAIIEPLKRLAELMKRDKRIELLVYALLAVLGILLYTASCENKKEATAEAAVAIATQVPLETAVEEKLAETLSAIRGAGKVRVMITYDTGVQIVPAMSTEVQSSVSESSVESGATTVNENRTESSRPATVQDEALVLTEKAPSVRGVIVIAEGAADIGVKLKLQSAVQTVLGVKIDQIEVFEMSRQDYE